MVPPGTRRPELSQGTDIRTPQCHGQTCRLPWPVGPIARVTLGHRPSTLFKILPPSQKAAFTLIKQVLDGPSHATGVLLGRSFHTFDKDRIAEFVRFVLMRVKF